MNWVVWLSLCIASASAMMRSVTLARRIVSFPAACPQVARSYSVTRLSAAEISAAMVKELRTLSGAPMLDCKQALSQESVNGDMQKAMDWLRAKGLKKLAASQRVTNEGLVAVHQSSAGSKRLSLVEVNCETDFVSMNKDFQRFASHVVRTVASDKSAPRSLTGEEVLQLVPQEGPDLQKALGDIVTTIRETIAIKRATTYEATSQGTVDVVSSYVHGKVGSDVSGSDVQLGKSAGVVHLSATIPASLSAEQVASLSTALHEQVGRKLAMHIVAGKPQFLESKAVPQEVIDAELAIFREQMKDEKKKESVMEGILKGKLNKRLGEICLLGQEHFAEEGNPVVGKYLDSMAPKLGVDKIVVKSFYCWSLAK